MGRLEAQLLALGAQVAHLTTVATETRSELKAHANLQAIRTTGRDRELDAVRSVLREHEEAIDSANRWRWTITGRMAGLMAGSAVIGTGAVTAVARLWGG